MADRHKIAYEQDLDSFARIPGGASSGHIVAFGSDGTLRDTGKTVDSFATAQDISHAVDEASDGIWSAVEGEYAIAAYGADGWKSEASYAEGDFCIYRNEGWRCVRSHSPKGYFDNSDWKKVLTESGKDAIDNVLSRYSVEGKAALTDLAPSFRDDATYGPGQLVLRNGKLWISTRAGVGDDAGFTDGATVEMAISVRIAAALASRNKIVFRDGSVYAATPDSSESYMLAKHSDIPTHMSELEDDAGYAKESALDAEYDPDREGGYSIGDTCTYRGLLYRCTAPVEEGSPWNGANWTPTTVKSFMDGGFVQRQADWDDSDSSSPTYIRNKPEIPPKVEIDDSLENAGQAADAKAVGDALDSLAAKVGYSLVNCQPKAGLEPTEVAFDLQDRCVNVVKATSEEMSGINTIRLNLPDPYLDRSDYGRDFYVHLDVDSAKDVNVATSVASLEDYAGALVELVAQAGRKGTTYHFTEIFVSQSGNQFMVTGFADPAWKAVQEIERAMDVLLADGGAGVYEPGIHLPDQNGYLHQVMVLGTPDGEYGIGVDQQAEDR